VRLHLTSRTTEGAHGNLGAITYSDADIAVWDCPACGFANADAFGELSYNYFPYLRVDVDGILVTFYRSAMNHILVRLPAGHFLLVAGQGRRAVAQVHAHHHAGARDPERLRLGLPELGKRRLLDLLPPRAPVARLDEADRELALAPRLAPALDDPRQLGLGADAPVRLRLALIEDRAPDGESRERRKLFSFQERAAAAP